MKIPIPKDDEFCSVNKKFYRDLDEEERRNFVQAKYIYLDDGSLIKVHKNAEVYVYGAIDKRSIVKQINVTEGNVKFEVSKQGSEDFTVITPTSVASVKESILLLNLIFSGSPQYAPSE